MNNNNKKILGRSAGSLNAPIAAFTMAVVLCSYCFSSIRAARRETAEAASSMAAHREKSETRQQQQLSWVHQALEEQREVEQRRKG